MGPDVAAQVRVGVIYVMLTATVTFVVVSVILMSQNFSAFQQRSSTSISYIQQGTLQRANGKIMSAPAAYRILEEAEGATLSLTITIDSHKYYDYTVLMEEDNITREFYFDGVPDASGSWDITLTEK